MNFVAGINIEDTGVQIDSDHVIICLHGIGGNSDSFAPQLQAFSNRARVIAWNMPGYGGSSPLPDTTFDALANALSELMDSLAISQAHLVGQSIGGMIVQEFALRYPARVRSLALIATTSAFGGRDDSFKTSFLKARLAPLDAGNRLADLASEFVPQIVGPNVTADALQSAIASMAAVPESSYREVLKCLVTFNRRDDIVQLKLPCCLIAGAVDTNAPAKTMRKMADAIPGADYHCIADAGHLVNLEYPQETNAILEAFWGLNESAK